MSDFVILTQVQGPAGASGAGVSGTGLVTVLNGGLVSPAIGGTVGQFLVWAGATAIAFATLTGDLVNSTVTPGLVTVSGITGAANVGAVHAGTLQYDSGASAGGGQVLLTQASTANAVATNLTLAPQTSTAASNRAPGSLVVSLGAATGTGAHPQFVVGGDGMASYFALQQAVGFGAGSPAIYFGVGVAGNPSGTNYLFNYSAADSNLHFNNGNNTDTVFEIAGIELMRLSAIAHSNFLELGVGGLTWTAIASAPTISQLSTSSSPGLNTTIQAQGSTSATGVGGDLVLQGGSANGATSGTPGNVVANALVPSGTGAEAAFLVKRNNTVYLALQRVVGGTAGAIYGGQGVSPNANNYSVLLDGINVTINAPSAAGFVQIGLGNASTSLTIGPNGLNYGTANVTIATSGNTTLTAAQYMSPIISLNAVTLTAAATVTFPNVAGVWLVDVSAVTLGGFTLAFKSGTATSATISSIPGTSQVVMVRCTGSNGISINV